MNTYWLNSWRDREALLRLLKAQNIDAAGVDRNCSEEPFGIRSDCPQLRTICQAFELGWKMAAKGRR